MNRLLRLAAVAIVFTMSVGICQAQDIYSNYGQDDAEAAAAREARCNARLMNDPDLTRAMSNIAGDLAEVQEIVKEANVNAANEKLAIANDMAEKANDAHKKGQYCKANDFIKAAYGAIADTYAAMAASHAARLNTEVSISAAETVAIYAEASHYDGLDCAMAASRNAKINNDIASGAKVRIIIRR